MPPADLPGVRRLAEAFAAGSTEDRALLMPFLVCGYPDEGTFVEIARAVGSAGADVIEIGIPFSDPIMDGPVIQAATHRVLEAGLPTSRALELVSRAATTAAVPVVVMTYYNLIFRHGLERFARDAASAGVAGVIVPDLSVEDSAQWRSACAAAGLAPVFIAAQTSTGERLRAIAGAAEGFIYAASLLGVTGLRDSLDARASDLVERIRAVTSLPIAVGIGVSTEEHARAAARYADGVIVGSALVDRIARADDPVTAAKGFVADLRAAVARP